MTSATKPISEVILAWLGWQLQINADLLKRIPYGDSGASLYDLLSCATIGRAVPIFTSFFASLQTQTKYAVMRVRYSVLTVANVPYLSCACSVVCRSFSSWTNTMQCSTRLRGWTTSVSCTSTRVRGTTPSVPSLPTSTLSNWYCRRAQAALSRRPLI